MTKHTYTKKNNGTKTEQDRRKTTGPKQNAGNHAKTPVTMTKHTYFKKNNGTKTEQDRRNTTGPQQKRR